MQTRYLYLLRFILPVIDLCVLNAVYLLSFEVASKVNSQVYTERQTHYLIICNLLWITGSLLFGLYTDHASAKIERIYRATWKTVVLHGILFTFYLFFSRNSEFSRTFLLLFYGLLVLACMVSRFLGTLFEYYLLKKVRMAKSVAIIGNNYTAARLKQYLKRQKNVNFYGFIGTHDDLLFEENDELPDEIVQQLAHAVEAGVNDLYVCIPLDKMTKVKSLVREADRKLIRLKFIPDMGPVLGAPYTVSYLGGEFPMMKIRNEPLEDMSNRFKKRAFDTIFSFLVIVFILSWLYPIIAILIKLESKGPVLFKQQRSGRNDQPFWCYKFRSMELNGSSHTLQTTKNDARITRVGRFLRKTSIDEFPQFFNVLIGNMSVVGPRPHMLKHTSDYRKLIDKFMVRHFSKPGITGWAQVNGLRGETKRTEDMERRVEHDIHYVENWSLMWDVKIVFLTLINLVQGEDHVF